MIYTINSIVVSTTKTGKQKADATLTDTTNAQFKNVTIWSDFPNFPALTVGMQIEGNINVKQNGQYTNTTLYPNVANPTANRTPGANKGTMGGGMMAVKAQNIERAQESKAEGIMISSTIRMAVDIMNATKSCEGKTPEQIKEEIMKWRYWLVSKWNQVSQPKISSTGEDYPEQSAEEIPF